MARYCVNSNPQPNGDHEVHNLDAGCSHLPLPEHRTALGDHTTCTTAVQKARQFYTRANGCYWCANACHTG